MPKTIFRCGCCLLCFANGVSSVHFYFPKLDFTEESSCLVNFYIFIVLFAYSIQRPYPIHSYYNTHIISLLRFTRVHILFCFFFPYVIHIISSKLRSNLFVMNADSIMGKLWKNIATLCVWSTWSMTKLSVDWIGLCIWLIIFANKVENILFTDKEEGNR